MFDEFDPSLLSDPDFKEDSVREEIVVPILRRLGYSASGPNKIIRSKGLLHPFVMIGSKKHPINIIPDYLLCADGRPGLVLDAKEPNAKLVKSKHAEQAYSYAIHPEVRTRFYALCSGRQLVAYDTQGIAPIFVLDFADIDSNWELVESVLSPKNVSMFAQSHFQPDYGTAMMKMGYPTRFQWIFSFVKFFQFSWVREDLYTMSVGSPICNEMHIVSFDSNKEIFDRILSFTDDENRDYIVEHLTPGHMVTAKRPIYLSLNTVVGDETRGQFESFVPFMILDVVPLDEQDFLAAEAMGNAGDAT
jgi:Type I restriction enzyme R protein N terminus (HSDR_N)